ncbi:MAG: phosphate signaling complex protein PhoU [Mariniphaga sp.]
MENYRIFDSELERLAHKVIQMCSQVNQQLIDVVSALKTADLKLAKKVINNDEFINNLDVKIDKLCQKIFALQQPVASDLRYIISALKINNDLERIGDHAVSIAKRIEPLQDYYPLVQELRIDKIGEKITTLFSDVVELVKTHDLAFAEEITRKAEEIKEECETIGTRILGEMMHQSEVVVVAANILIINNLLERIASYSTNIAESITFVVNGEIVKHRKHN